MPNWKKVIVSGSDASLNSLYASSITGSHFGTSSYAILALTASYFSGSISTAISSSYALQSTSASYALSASWAPGGSGTPTFPYTGDASISGSLNITGSLYVNGVSITSGGGSGSSNISSGSAKLNQTSLATTWSFNHFLGEKYPNVTVYDSNDFIVQPSGIRAVDTNSLVITFASPMTGRAIATLGGGGAITSGSITNALTASYTLLAGNAVQAQTASYFSGNVYNSSTAVIDFGFWTGSEDANTTTTVSASWITNNSIIKISPSSVTSSHHTAEDYMIECIQAEVINITNGVSFDIMAYAPQQTFGTYNIICTQLYI